MKKTILVIIICIIALSLLLTAIRVATFFHRPAISLNLPLRNGEAPKNLDTSSDTQVAKLRANYGFVVDGYCETEADNLRDKILNSPNTDKLYEITGTKYYVSSSEGDDDNDGLTPETAIKTLSRMNEFYVTRGDAFLFKRGDTFRFGESLNTENGIIYGSYGEGTKPKIYGSPENYADSDNWEFEKENVWKIPFDYPEACGCVINHSQLIGIKKRDNITNLQKNGDYFHDTVNGIFYLFCDIGNPNDAYHDIEIMPSTNIIEVGGDCENLILDNLCIKYSSGFGIHALEANDITITNCELGFLGGKWTNNEKTLRYGNAIEFWLGGENITVENNWLYQTFDSALTWQGNEGRKYTNISFSNNLFEYNNADIEFFETDGFISNFVIKNNIMRFTSMGWGTRREDGGIRGIEGCIRGVTGSHPRNKSSKVESIYVTDNIIDCPARQTINLNIDPEQISYIHASGTQFHIKSDYRTLHYYLQGLQTNKLQFYNYGFAKDYKGLKKGIKIFDKSAKIHWDSK